MTQAIVDHILEEIRTLAPEELRYVRQAIEEQLHQPNPDADQVAAAARFRQALLESGLVKEIKSLRPGSYVEPPLVPIKGKPLSETIVEERR